MTLGGAGADGDLEDDSEEGQAGVRAEKPREGQAQAGQVQAGLWTGLEGRASLEARGRASGSERGGLGALPEPPHGLHGFLGLVWSPGGQDPLPLLNTLLFPFHS